MKKTIICEIGINWFGDMNIARKLIEDASDIGCDMAKWQYYSSTDLFNDPKKDTYRPDVYELVKPFELDEAKIEQLMKWCDLYNIEFGCSVFDMERFNILESMGIKSHKIASRVSKYDRDLAIAILETGKPCYVSTGFDAEHFDSKKYINIHHLYCEAKYPTNYEDLIMPSRFGTEYMYQGFSSHLNTPHACKVAIARGASVIEAHFILDRGMAMLPGAFDVMSSLDKLQMAEVVKFAREMEKMDI